MEIAHGKHTPTPGRLYLRPSIVYYWNAVKGGVDVMSRELSHVLPKLRFQAKSFLAVRFLLMQLRNVFRLQRVVLAHKFGSDALEWLDTEK